MCDCSGSMEDPIGSLNLSKFDHLMIALRDIYQTYPKIRVVAFSSRAKVLPEGAYPPHPRACSLGGGTNLAEGLLAVEKFKPRKTIVISDGIPDSEDQALQAAQQITGAIDTIYCGPDSHPAIQFLHQLARSTGGMSATWDGFRELSGAIKGFLPAPAVIVTAPPE